MILITFVSMLLSVAICWPFFGLIELEARARGSMLLLAAGVPLVIAPISLVPLFGLMAKLEQAKASLARLARTDGLTGLLNRTALFERASAEWALAARHGSALSLLMLDVDHFKRFNDTYGHAFGDEALQGIAEAVATVLRESDSFGRYGGEEFVIVLPSTDAVGAATLATRILEAVRQLKLRTRDGEAVRVTLSVGLATRRADVPSLEHLLAIADRTLYSAKAAGRNRSVQSMEEIGPVAMSL